MVFTLPVTTCSQSIENSRLGGVFFFSKSRSETSRQGAGFTPNLTISYPKCGWHSSSQNLISTL
ncbi:hypothetical protein Hanom_Chr12g01164291 [Helianthus anomalus]